MAKGILTNREVKNKVTGVDIYVSDYQEVPHRVKNEFLYHVIVVSNLFYYKTREHRESDVVQFMVSKTFSEFEDLYKRLYKRFPSVNFPSLPKKTLLSTNASANLECMDKVLKMVACTQKLSSSPMVISFLRGDKGNAVKDDVDEDIEQEEVVPEVNNVHKEKVEEGKQQDESEFQEVDLFASKQEEIVEEEIFTENIQDVSSGRSIFDEDVIDAMKTGGDNDLFAADEENMNTNNDKEYDLNAELDILELSDSDCEVDELLNLSKLSEKQASIKVQKTQPCKHRANNMTKENENIFDNITSSGNIFDSKTSGKEDMFTKSKQTSKKCLWRDHNHHTIDDIFSSKQTSLFDSDDGDDIFRTSKKKVEVKVEDMKQDDIMDYIKQHNVESRNGESHNVESHNVELNNVESPIVDSHNVESPIVDSHNVESRNGESHNVESHNVESHNVESHNVESHNVESHNVGSHNVESHNVESHNVESHNVESHNVESHNVESQYVESHNGDSHNGELHHDESMEFSDEKNLNVIDLPENDTSIFSKEFNSLEHTKTLSPTEQVECSVPATNIQDEASDVSLTTNDAVAVVEENPIEALVEEDKKDPSSIDIYNTAEDEMSLNHHAAYTEEENELISGTSGISKDTTQESSSYIEEEQKDDIVLDVTYKVEEVCNRVELEANIRTQSPIDWEDSFIPTVEQGDFIVNDYGGKSVGEGDFSTGSFAAVEEGSDFIRENDDTTHVREEQSIVIATENVSIEDFNT